MKSAASAACEGETQSSTKPVDRSVASASSLRARCLLCEGSRESRLLFHTSRPIFQCTSCSLVYADPRDAPAVGYSEDYYRHGVYADYLADRDAIHRNASRVLAELERMVAGRKLLDVGCATGFFLEAARSRRWDVCGLEPSEYASDFARRQLGLQVDTASIVSPPEGLPRFDVVTLWDTIEHLDRPDVALANIRRLLEPNGVLVFSTGDYASLVRRLTGKRWRLFADPTHNFFFDEETLRLLLMRAGFEVVRITRRGKRVGFSLILHQSGLPLSARFSAWLLAKGWNPSVYVNLRDVVTIFARSSSKAMEETGPR